MNPTPEQSAILDAADSTKDNLMIVARAGCGKTSTLEMIDRASPPTEPHLLLCFNKAIADEAQKKVRSITTVRTFNSLGHRIWAAACAKRLALNGKKINEIFRSLVEEAPKHERGAMWGEYDSVTQGVNLARAIGYIPPSHAKADKSLCGSTTLYKLLDELPSSLGQSLIDRVLMISIKWAYDGIIDFSDQCYMPALFGGTYPSFPLVMVDEYQDLSPINHAMVAKLCKRSRQIGVGDDAQAIYGFRGATEGGMPLATSKFGMRVLPLSKSFRCPSRLVQNVHWRVPEFSWVREGGIVETLDKAEILDGGVVICRNNAPLVHLAMRLVSQGRSVDVSGADISGRIVRLLSKLGDDSISQASALAAVDEWEAARDARESKSAADTAECMRVFIRHGRTLGQAIGYADSLFKQSGQVKFTTGHKSKGQEFLHVYHLDSWLLKEAGQDPNLRYVIDTRAKERLTYIDTMGVL